ncbi:MAG: DUF86 domain-containing protein [Methanosarcinales archaeon]|nr:DUF86 domain-containing protein [Methanosarcinales archaeon]
MTRYVEELKEMLPDKEEYLQHLIRRRACEKTIEVAIESLIDVSAMGRDPDLLNWHSER